MTTLAQCHFAKWLQGTPIHPIERLLTGQNNLVRPLLPALTRMNRDWRMNLSISHLRSVRSCGKGAEGRRQCYQSPGSNKTPKETNRPEKASLTEGEGLERAHWCPDGEVKASGQRVRREHSNAVSYVEVEALEPRLKGIWDVASTEPRMAPSSQVPHEQKRMILTRWE